MAAPAATGGRSAKAGRGVVGAIRQTFIGSIRPGVGHAAFHHAARRRLLTCNGTRAGVPIACGVTPAGSAGNGTTSARRCGIGVSACRRRDKLRRLARRRNSRAGNNRPSRRSRRNREASTLPAPLSRERRACNYGSTPIGFDERSGRRRTDPQHRAESPRIVIAQQRAVVEYDVDMIVRPAGRRVAEDAKRSRHAEVNEQCRASCVEQQVLAAAIDAFDRASAHAGVEVRGNRPAQTRVVYVDPNHAPARDMRRDSTPGRFDFGEFRHPGEPAIDGMRRWRQ